MERPLVYHTTDDRLQTTTTNGTTLQPLESKTRPITTTIKTNTIYQKTHQTDRTPILPQCGKSHERQIHERRDETSQPWSPIQHRETDTIITYPPLP